MSCICSRLNSPSFLTFYFCVRYIKALIILIGSMALILESPVRGTALQLCPTGAELRRINSLDLPAVLAFAGFSSGFFVYQDKYSGSSLQSCLPASKMCHVMVPGVITPQVQDQPFPVVPCCEMLVTPFLLSVEVPLYTLHGISQPRVYSEEYGNKRCSISFVGC